MRKRTLIRKAERAIPSVRRGSHLKPLQQGLGLRMVSEDFMPFFDGYGYGCHRQHFHRIAGLKVALTDVGGRRLVGELPDGRGVVNEGIVEGLGSLVGERGYILESGAEKSWRDPARVLGNPAGLRYCARTLDRKSVV